MYRVLCDGYTLHDPSLNDVNYMLISPVLTQEANKADSFTFSIARTHANANALQRLKSVIEVFDDNKRLFRGRILNDTRDWDDTRQVVCESDLAWLNDTVKRPFAALNYSAAAYFRWLITYHNNLAPDDHDFVIGDVTVTGTVNLPENAGYPTIWHELETNLLQQFGGYLFVTYDDTTGKNRIDYLADSPNHSTQKIAFGENLLDITRESKGEDIITRLIPLGAKDERTGKPITIKSVNDNNDYIADAAAEAIYGRIWGVEIWDTVTSPAELLLKGQQRLAQRAQGITSITLTAVDLHLLDSSINSFDFLSYVTVDDPAHGITGEMLVTRKVTDLTDPSNGTITIGEENRGISKFYAGTDAQIARIYETYSTEAEMRAVETDVNGEIQQLSTEVYSEIQTQADKIALVVTESSGGYVIRSAQIAAAINQEDGSTVYIDADHIRVNGQMVVSAINGGSTTIDGSKITTGTMNADRIGAGTIDADVINVINVDASKITVKDNNNNIIFAADGPNKTTKIGGFTVTKNAIKYTANSIDKVEVSNTVIASRDRYSEIRMENGGIFGSTDGDPTWGGIEATADLHAGTGMTITRYNNGAVDTQTDITSREMIINAAGSTSTSGTIQLQAMSPRIRILAAGDEIVTINPKSITFDDGTASAGIGMIKRTMDSGDTTRITLERGVYLAITTHTNNSTGSQTGLAIIQAYDSTSSILEIAAAGNSTLSVSGLTLTWTTTNTYRALRLIKLS